MTGAKGPRLTWLIVTATLVGGVVFIWIAPPVCLHIFPLATFSLCSHGPTSLLGILRLSFCRSSCMGSGWRTALEACRCSSSAQRPWHWPRRCTRPSWVLWRSARSYTRCYTIPVGQGACADAVVVRVGGVRTAVLQSAEHGVAGGAWGVQRIGRWECGMGEKSFWGGWCSTLNSVK
jgi:hypothetical protein